MRIGNGVTVVLFSFTSVDSGCFVREERNGPSHEQSSDQVLTTSMGGGRKYKKDYDKGIKNQIYWSYQKN